MRRKQRKEEDSFICPVCGAEVPLRAPACPECGSDDETGWSEDTIYDGIDLPEEDETGGGTFSSGIIGDAGPTLFRSRTLFLVAALLAVILFLLFLLH